MPYRDAAKNSACKVAYAKSATGKKNNVMRVKRHKEVRLAWLAELKSKPCEDCGGLFPPECMDYDHLPGMEKVASVSRLITASKAVVLAEIAKCDLICANCHRIRTKRRANAN